MSLLEAQRLTATVAAIACGQVLSWWLLSEAVGVRQRMGALLIAVGVRVSAW